MWYIYFARRIDKWSYYREVNTAFTTREEAHERIRHVVRVRTKRIDGLDFVYRVVRR